MSSECMTAEGFNREEVVKKGFSETDLAVGEREK